MSAYTVTIKRSAEKEMDGLPGDVFDRVAESFFNSKTTRGAGAARNCGARMSTGCVWGRTAFCIP